MKVKIIDNNTTEQYQVELDIYNQPLEPLRIEEYTEKSFAVFGSTKEFKSLLLEKGGKFRPNLNGNPGWIFSKKRLTGIQPVITAINRLYCSKEVTISLQDKATVNATLFNGKELEIVPISEGTFHLKGNTKLFEDELISLGCQQIASDGDKDLWYFTRNKLNAVKALVSAINKLI